VDGLSHFVGREPTGATLLKRRQLEHFGWWLVSVPYWEWKKLRDKTRRRVSSGLPIFLLLFLRRRRVSYASLCSDKF